MSIQDMQIGEAVMEDDKYGCRCVECDCGHDPHCDMCDGTGKVYEMIAPAHEIAEAFANILAQMPGKKH